MIRVRDPKASLDFYTRILGMDLIDEHKGGDFTLYFLGFDASNGKDTAEEKRKGRSTREALLELTHNVSLKRWRGGLVGREGREWEV